MAEAFGKLQDYDFELFQAIRNKEKVTDGAQAKLQSAVDALDGLLATVPPTDLSKAKVCRLMTRPVDSLFGMCWVLCKQCALSRTLLLLFKMSYETFKVLVNLKLIAGGCNLDGR